MSCDDNCQFKLSSDDVDPLDPSQATTRNYVGGWSRYRTTDIQDKSPTSSELGKKFSETMQLTQDKYYYVEATLNQGPGDININVGMEI